MATLAATVCLGAALSQPATVRATPTDIRFSVDPASVSVAADLTPDDVLVAGPRVLAHGTSFGLQSNPALGIADNLNAISYGRDPISNPLYFSVDRLTLGKDESDVARLNRTAIDAARHVYVALPPSGTNVLSIDGTRLGLIPGFLDDDLNGLSLLSGPVTFFSLDGVSASIGKIVVPGQPGVRSSDILSSTGNGSFGFFKRAEEIGLSPFDEIDALVLDAAGIALFSLSAASPSTTRVTGLDYRACIPGHMSPADVCRTEFAGSYSRWAAADSMGLLEQDNIDALATFQEPAAISEPATILLLALSLVGLGMCGSRVRGEPRCSPRAKAADTARTTTRPVGSPPRSTRLRDVQAIVAGVLTLLAAAGPVGAQSLLESDVESFDLAGPGFFGTSPPVAGSRSTLYFPADVAGRRVFRWHSNDPILGEISTGGFVSGAQWTYLPGPPARLLFIAVGGGAQFVGDVLFEPHSRAVVDVVKGGRRVRYLLLSGCAAPTLAAPQPAPIAAHMWTMNASVSASDGLIVENVQLGTRLLARSMTVPYFHLGTTAFSGGGELTPAGTADRARSRLVDFHREVDADRLSIEASYAIDRISDTGSKSCLVVNQHYQFSRLNDLTGGNLFSDTIPPFPGSTDKCEPSDATFLRQQPVQCGRFRPTVRYHFLGDRGEELQRVEIPIRLVLLPDGSFQTSALLIKDDDVLDLINKPIPFESSDNPLLAETLIPAITAGVAGPWDNYHQAPRVPVGLPLPPPGCPLCAHLHWRWAAFMDFPSGTAGRTIIPFPSNQSVDIAIVRFRFPENPNFDFRALSNGESLVNEQLVLWYGGAGFRKQDSFFIHWGFFSTSLRVSFLGALAIPGGFRYLFRVTNITGDEIPAPISLVLDGLAATPVSPLPSGTTAVVPPVGSPYFVLPVASLAGGASTELLPIDIPGPFQTFKTRMLTGNVR